MSKEKLTELLRHAYQWGRDNGSNRSEKSFNDFLQTEAIRQALSLCSVVAILPTDEEIKEMMTTSHYHFETGHHRKIRLDRIQGAKMVRDLIKKRIQGG